MAEMCQFHQPSVWGVDGLLTFFRILPTQEFLWQSSTVVSGAYERDAAVLGIADRERHGVDAGRCHLGRWVTELCSWDLFPLDNGTVSPLWEPEGCVSRGRGCALLR